MEKGIRIAWNIAFNFALEMSEAAVRQLAAISGFRGFVGAGIQCDFPAAIGLLAPDGDVAASLFYGIAAGVFAAALEMSPRVSDIAGRAHLRVSGSPGKLIILGQPGGGLHNGNAAHHGLLAVSEGYAVLCKPVGKGRAAAFQYIFGETRLEVEEQDFARLGGGVCERIGCGCLLLGKCQLGKSGSGCNRCQKACQNQSAKQRTPNFFHVLAPPAMCSGSTITAGLINASDECGA